MSDMVLPGETPAQRGLRLVRTDPAMRDRMASNMFAHHRGLRHPDGYWQELPEEERAAWRERMLTELAEDAGEMERPAGPDIGPAAGMCVGCGEMPAYTSAYCDWCMDERAAPEPQEGRQA